MGNTWYGKDSKAGARSGVRDAEGSELLAVASRNPDSAEEFAKELGIPKSYGSYVPFSKTRTWNLFTFRCRTTFT